MDVRLGTDEDLPTLQALWPMPGGVHEAHLAAQATGDAAFLVAWEEREPLGSAMVQWQGCVGTNARIHFPHAAEINHLQVRPQWRSRGVGSRLVSVAENLMAERGVLVAALGVGDDNPRAARLYLRLGFRPTDVRDVTDYVWNDDGQARRVVERTQLLVKHLGASRVGGLANGEEIVE